MFNLIVAGTPEYWDQKWISIQRSRFLGHTEIAIKARFEKADSESFEQLSQLPTLFMPEGGSDTEGWIGEITQVRTRGLELGFTRTAFPGAPRITWGALEEVFWELDIHPRERTHTHWAVKEADLIATLQSEGVIPPEFSPATSVSPDTPRPSRADLLTASKDLEQLGHAEFDRFILELGVDGLEAGRSLGGLAARGNALGKFALDHPQAKTVDNKDLWSEISKRAAVLRAARPGMFQDTTEVGAIRPWLAPAAPDQTPSRSVPMPSRADAEVAAMAVGRSAVAGKEVAMPTNKVFLVHGRADGPKDQVARFLETIGLEVVILHERPNRGRSLISKFQEESADVSYAIVLMTPDDEGGLQGETMSPRARQNVVFELGFFIGKLEARNVCALVAEGIERPSDFESVVYVGFDPHGAWRANLARELRDAGIPFNHSKVF